MRNLKVGVSASDDTRDAIKRYTINIENIHSRQNRAVSFDGLGLSITSTKLSSGQEIDEPLEK